MRLLTKLLIMSFFVILIPMLIILLFSAFMLYQTSAISQWEYLKSIRDNFENEILNSEVEYLRVCKTAANTDFISDKLYVYEKYWTQLTDSLIAYDLKPVNSYLKDLSQKNDIETIAIYRRFHDNFNLVAQYGKNEYLPDVLYKDAVQKDYSSVKYRRYSDGLYLDVVYPVFSDGKLVGLVKLMRSYNEKFLIKYSETFEVDYALISKNVMMFNSNEITSNAIRQIVDDGIQDKRISFRAGSSTYNGFQIPFSLSGEAYGVLIIFLERMNLFSSDFYLMQRLIVVTLLCIMIPVLTFFIKEIRLIKTINSLLAATNNISSGNYNSMVEVRSRDEMGELINNFNEMIAVLKKNREDLEKQNTELSMKNSYIDAVFQSLRINIIVLNTDGKIKVVSKNASSRLELTEEQYGYSLLETEPFVQERRLLEKTLEDVFSARKFTRLYSVKFGNTSYEMDFYPVMESDKKLSAVVLILNNITERMNIERALMQSDRLASVGQMAAGLAHEINNPMSIILNHVQLLQTDKLIKSEKERFVGRIESEIKRVSKLINNLLKFSRDEQYVHERNDLSELFAEVIGLFDPKASAEKVDEFYSGITIIDKPASIYRINFNKKIISLYVEEQIETAELVCNRDSLKQVLFNIMKNAFESCTSEAGIVWTGVEFVKEGIRLTLSDNGCGISDEELLNVFELFYTQGKPGTGVGLGLPLCRRLMNNMGGEIGISSEKGKGTRVSLLFPA
ncbi:MAG: ATP-binding protein [Spirochaetales bacterium]|uniref:histidine kinase n=1 Tax=Candidatus Thalassospirochaeta sargassi TaxID=3119039 RepID=A0AAJ1IHF0_9SPIO|nr:ATP-binding protein [Spirochaetales bacterium]